MPKGIRKTAQEKYEDAQRHSEAKQQKKETKDHGRRVGNIPKVEIDLLQRMQNEYLLNVMEPNVHIPCKPNEGTINNRCRPSVKPNRSGFVKAVQSSTGKVIHEVHKCTRRGDTLADGSDPNKANCKRKVRKIIEEVEEPIMTSKCAKGAKRAGDGTCIRRRITSREVSPSTKKTGKGGKQLSTRKRKIRTSVEEVEEPISVPRCSKGAKWLPKGSNGNQLCVRRRVTRVEEVSPSTKKSCKEGKQLFGTKCQRPVQPKGRGFTMKDSDGSDRLYRCATWKYHDYDVVDNSCVRNSRTA